jgi:hypothetical protein
MPNVTYWSSHSQAGPLNGKYPVNTSHRSNLCKTVSLQCYLVATVIHTQSVPSDGPSSSVGIATDCWLDCPGIESRFSAVQTDLGAHPASCTMSTGSFPGVNCGWGVLLTTHPLLMPRSRKGTAIPLPTLEAI